MGRMAGTGMRTGAARTMAASTAIRQRRQVSDDILIAFHFACDLKDLVIAQKLLQALEVLVAGRSEPSDANRQRAIATLVAAHERLWNLRTAETEASLPLGEQALALRVHNPALAPAIASRFGPARG